MWDLVDPKEETGGTRRYWKFDISGWQESTLPFPLAWGFLDSSPFIPEQRRETPAGSPLSLRVGRAITVPAERSILDTLLDAGVAVPHDCKRGECTMCTTRVLDGEPDHRDLCLNSEERASSMCVCVSRAQGEELKLDL